LPSSASLEHLGPENVRRHQVRRELDAAGVESPSTVPSVIDQLGLGKAGHADQQCVTAAED
jgi:hypothetical protein